MRTCLYVIVFSTTLLHLQCKNESKLTQPKALGLDYSKNIETVGIVLNLSAMGDYILNNFSTSTNQYALIRFHNEAFEKFKNHEAVQWANKMAEANLLQFNDYYYGLYYTPFPDFEKLNLETDATRMMHTDLSDSLVMSYHKSFNSALRKFYQDAEMEKHFEKYASVYSDMLDEVAIQSQQIPLEALSDLLTDGKDSTDIRYHLLPSLNIPIGFNFGPNLQQGNQLEFYFIFGPSEELNPMSNPFKQTTVRNLGFSDTGAIADLAVHEFTHSFVRFLQYENMETAMIELRYLNTPELKRAMAEIGQAEHWSNVFEEHLVRACEILLWRKLGHLDKAEEKLEAELKEGFIYIPDFLQALESYTSSRSEYPSLESYMPVLFQGLRDKYSR